MRMVGLCDEAEQAVFHDSGSFSLPVLDSGPRIEPLK